MKINQKWGFFADQGSRDPIWFPLLCGGTGCRAARICCWPKLQTEEGFMKDSNAVFRVKAGPTSVSSCCPVQDCTITPVCSAYPDIATSGQMIRRFLPDWRILSAFLPPSHLSYSWNVEKKPIAELSQLSCACVRLQIVIRGRMCVRRDEYSIKGRSCKWQSYSHVFYLVPWHCLLPVRQLGPEPMSQSTFSV